MGTDQMLDLFSIDEGKKGQSAAPSGSQSDQSQGKRDTVKSVLEGLGDLWDENQYEAEYDMSSFMKSLAKWFKHFSVFKSEGKRETVKSVLEGLGDLWDENQYEAEYDMSYFMKSLAKWF